jgi:hypothetical protein
VSPKKEIEMLPPLKKMDGSLFLKTKHVIKELILIGTEDNMKKVWFSNQDFSLATDRLK